MFVLNRGDQWWDALDLKQVIGAFMFEIEKFIQFDDISNTPAETNDLIESYIRSYWIQCFIWYRFSTRFMHKHTPSTPWVNNPIDELVDVASLTNP